MNIGVTTGHWPPQEGSEESPVVREMRRGLVKEGEDQPKGQQCAE